MTVVAPSIYHGADIVAAIAMNIDKCGVWKQSVEIWESHHIDAGLVENATYTQPLIEIA